MNAIFKCPYDNKSCKNIDTAGMSKTVFCVDCDKFTNPSVEKNSSIIVVKSIVIAGLIAVTILSSITYCFIQLFK